jgi:non-ribosomal peptide synthetase component F
LTVTFDRPTSAVNLTLNYSLAVLTAAAATCVLHQLDDILKHVLSHPADLYLPSAAQVRPSLRSAVNPAPTPHDVPVGELLHSAFERHTLERPHSLALWFKHTLDDESKDVKWTYAALSARANKLARAIRGVLGRVKDEPIPIYMEKSPEMYVAILGVLKAGAGWCPLDPSAPAARNRDLLVRARGRLVLFATEEEKKTAITADVIPEGMETLALDEACVVNAEEGPLAGGAEPNGLSYLIWTSGTTGAPKVSYDVVFEVRVSHCADNVLL